MANVFLSLGTNLGDKKSNLVKAYSALQREVGSILLSSDYYYSEPWGFRSENDFVNTVVELETSLSPHELLRKLKDIETEMGRMVKSNGTYADRIIDIDILFYDDLILESEALKIPHPLITVRDFVMKPLVQIAPAKIHPVLKKSISEINSSND